MFFDSMESSSGYSVNHDIDASSDSANFGIPKSLREKMQVKLLQNYCLDVLNIYSNWLTAKKLKYN